MDVLIAKIKIIPVLDIFHVYKSLLWGMIKVRHQYMKLELEHSFTL